MGDTSGRDYERCRACVLPDVLEECHPPIGKFNAKKRRYLVIGVSNLHILEKDNYGQLRHAYAPIPYHDISTAVGNKGLKKGTVTIMLADGANVDSNGYHDTKPNKLSIHDLERDKVSEIAHKLTERSKEAKSKLAAGAITDTFINMLTYRQDISTKLGELKQQRKDIENLLRK